MYPLQISCFQILLILPFAYKFSSSIPILIYFINWITSMLVHGFPISAINVFYIIDLIAIFFWGLINTYLCFHLNKIPIIPLFLCLLVIVLFFKRNLYPFQSKKRILYHSLMHLFGVLGTIILIIKCNSNLSFSLFNNSQDLSQNLL